MTGPTRPISPPPGGEGRHASPLPPYLRQSGRTHSQSSFKSTTSTSSARSVPHPQNEYKPGTTALPIVLGTYEGDLPPATPDDLPDQSMDDYFDGTTLASDRDPHEEDEVDWDQIREDAMNSKSKWRRPRPAWLYPFVFGTCFTMGMSGPPKAELFINLTCLMHPPQPSSVGTHDFSTSWTGTRNTPVGGWHAQGMPGGNPVVQVPIENGSMPITSPDTTIGGDWPQSPADKWFLKLQKDIYDWNMRHSALHSHDPVSSTTVRLPTTQTLDRPLPSGPIPHPPLPSDGDSGNSPSTPSPPASEPRPDADRPPFEAIDPRLCKRDPKVQAAAARLTMTLTVTLGVLSALTTGFWGKKSDRWGRTKVMIVVETGLLLNELAFILVASFPYLAPGGYRSLLIGPVLDGLAGGSTCFMATAHAYVSDLTPDGSRAAAFSRLMGMIMSGFACGPIIGALLIRLTDNIMTPFYASAVVHLVWPLLILLILPESLSQQARSHLITQAQRKDDAAKRKEALQRDWENEDSIAGQVGSHGKRRKRLMGNLRRSFKRIFHFLEPLTVFIPRQREDGRGKDWSLTMVGIGMFCAAMNMGVLSIKAQFVFFSFGWTTAELGPFMSTLAFTRGFILIVLLPLTMKLIGRSYQTATPRASTPSTVFDSSPDHTNSEASAPAPAPAPVQRHSSHLDLLTARFSFFIEMVGLSLLALNGPAPAFVAISILMTLGSGVSPSLNSLGLALLPSKAESGRLFGALSVLYAIGGSLISPVVFGNIFAATVGWYAPTAFGIAAILPLIGGIAMCMIRLEKKDVVGTAEEGRRGQSQASGTPAGKTRGRTGRIALPADD